MNKKPSRPFLFDAHLDLSMNAMEWNRDLRCDLDEIRRRETSMNDKKDRAKGVVCFPAMRRGNIGLCVATQIARCVQPGNSRSGWHSPEQAYAQTQAQLSWYRAMEKDRQLKQITNRKQLHHHFQQWPTTNRSHLQSAPGEENSPPALPIGYLLSLEGADSIVNLDYLAEAYASGLRAIGLAHYGPGTYAAGTNAEGGLTDRGRNLLHEMDQMGIILASLTSQTKDFKKVSNASTAPFGPAIRTAAPSRLTNANLTTHKSANSFNATPSSESPSTPECCSPVGFRASHPFNNALPPSKPSFSTSTTSAKSPATPTTSASVAT